MHATGSSGGFRQNSGPRRTRSADGTPGAHPNGADWHDPVQSRAECDGLKTNPFSSDFSLRDLFTSIEKRIEWYEQLLERAAREKCQLAVITEDFTRLGSCMTYLDDRSVFREAVEKQTPLIADRLGAVAKRHSLLVVACYFALDGDAIYNVADLFGRDGSRIGRYRKVHLPEYELWQVRAGDAFPAFETDIGWIGMLICYDQMWPESAACCAMNGAQIICQPSAASLTDYHMRTRAMDNQVHHVSSTYANSMIVTPRADVVADAKDQDPGAGLGRRRHSRRHAGRRVFLRNALLRHSRSQGATSQVPPP